MYTYEIKHDKNTNWTKLSVRTRIPLPEHELLAYVQQHAADRQQNPDQFAIRCIDIENKQVVFVRESDATANRG